MDFVKLNKSRHSVKQFDGKKIPTVDVKQIISAASLAPSSHNIQPWHFVIVESDERRQALLSEVKESNIDQVKNAGAVVVLFSDTDLASRSVEIAKEASDEMSDDLLLKYNSRYPQMFQNFDELYESNYLALNAGIVAMNLMYVVKNRGYEGNMIMGFEATSKINDILDVDRRYRPELILTMGSSEDTGKSSYRLPQEKIIEIR